MKLAISVTKKHINRGMRKSPISCPIALAIQEKTGHTVRVYGDGISVNIGGKNYAISDRASRFVSKFDRQGKKAVKPQNFVFERL